MHGDVSMMVVNKGQYIIQYATLCESTEIEDTHSYLSLDCLPISFYMHYVNVSVLINFS